ncbi:MAG: MgtC/SapB family protein [Nevskiaceae bacterium]|nr:MAG: MgtC/SapB family protein [Nevskiaceae bacterium]
MTSMMFLSQIVVALLLGTAIGLERQWRQRLAGLRTNALVAVGAAAFCALSGLSDAHGGVDPTRVAAQVVSGIGFLGGGIILKEGFNVRGLNTAATLWCSAAIGSLAGLGHLYPALMAATVVLLANVLLRPLAQLINRQPAGQGSEVEVCYLIEVTCRDRAESHIRNSLLQEASSETMLLRSLQRETVEGAPKIRIAAEVVTSGRADRQIERIVSRLSLEQGTSAIAWKLHDHAA